MVNDFFDWITIALHDEFGDDYKLYVEEVEQNLFKPCFVVSTLNPMVTAKSPVKYQRVIPIVIYYFTGKEDTVDAKKDCFNIAERLWERLEYLTNGEITLRGDSISWEMIDGVLQFFITYKFDVIRTTEQTSMGSASINGVPIP